MSLLKESFPDQDAIADADKSLRSASRLFSKGLARFATPRRDTIRQLDWGDTQVVARERRLDRSLNVDMVDDKRVVLHIEWALRLNERACQRAAQYHMESAFAARAEARTKRRVNQAKLRVSVKSVLVVLSGRKKRWPRYGKYQTSPPGKRFSGVRFRIVAVYQHTVEQLRRKGSIFWLAFVPLAKDVDEEKLRRTVATTKRRGTEEEFVEVISTMLSMAQLRKDRPEFVNVIRKAAGEENGMRHPWYEDGFAKGELKGRVEGKVEGLAPFVFAFEKRLGRALRARERERLAKRLTNEGPEKLGSVLIDYGPEELDAWLAPRKAKTVRTNGSSSAASMSGRSS